MPHLFKRIDIQNGSLYNTNKIQNFRYDVEVESNFSRRLRLAALREVVSYIVNNTSLPPGDYKIKFVPEEGSSFIPVFRQIRASDNCRFKIFEHNGHRIGEYSHKEFRSKIETERKQLGADPHNKAALLYCKVDDAYQEIRRILESKSLNLTQEMVSDLKKLEELTRTRMGERKSLLLESCKSEEHYIRLLQELQEFSVIVCKINALRAKAKNEAANTPKSFFLDSLYVWPMSEKFASKYAEFVNGKEISLFLRDWIRRYAQELKKASGVDLLEYSSYDMMRELEHAIMRAGSDAKKQDSFFEKANSLIFLLSNIKENVAAIDRKIENLVSKSVYCEEDLEKICEIARMRQNMLSSLRTLYVHVGELNNLYYNAAHLQMLVSTMASNLCKPGRNESNLWKELSKNESFQESLFAFRDYIKHLRSFRMLNSQEKHALKALENETKNLSSKINKYSNACEADIEKIRKSEEEASVGRSPFNTELKILETNLQNTLNKIFTLSPVVYKILAEAYADSKSHREYKMSLPLCHDANYYLAVSELLFVMATTENFESYSSRLYKYLMENSELYGLFEKWGLRQTILQHIDHFSYLKEKAFDFETDPEYLIKTGFHGATINVRYYVGIDAASSKETLYLKYENTLLSVPFPPKSYNKSAPYNKGVEEEFYGDKLPLDFFLGLNDGELEKMSLSQIYRAFATAASKDIQNYYRVQSLLRAKSMETAHFVSTLNIKKKLSGCVSNIAGENIPKELENENNRNNNEFDSNLRKIYPDYIKEANETLEFLFQKTNIRIFKELNRILPYLVRECARNIEKQAFASNV